MDDETCPASTGLITHRCPVEGIRHQCMREPRAHPVHTCWCGAQWVCSADLAEGLTQHLSKGLAYMDGNGQMWKAPIGSPPPGNPMPGCWIRVARRPTQ